MGALERKRNKNSTAELRKALEKYAISWLKDKGWYNPLIELKVAIFTDDVSVAKLRKMIDCGVEFEPWDVTKRDVKKIVQSFENDQFYSSMVKSLFEMQKLSNDAGYVTLEELNSFGKLVYNIDKINRFNELLLWRNLPYFIIRRPVKGMDLRSMTSANTKVRLVKYKRR
jgi:hypothetical protein